MESNLLARDILQYIGGKDNVSSYDHCSTRLRFVINDKTKIDYDNLEKTQGVLGVINSSNQLQVVIGNNVGVIYKEILNQVGEGAVTANSNANEEEEQGSIIQRLMQTISGIFVPVIPAIAGAGMIKALLTLLKASGLVDVQSETYLVMNFISDAPFYFLPFLLAYTSARRFKCSPILALCIAGVLLHPTFTSSRAEGLDLSVFGAPIVMANYAYSVISIILIVWVMSFVEVFAERVVPSVIKAIFKPLVILLVTSIVGLVVVGPIGTVIGEGLAVVLAFLDGIAPWLLPFITGAFAPLLVMTGMHYTLVPLTTIQLSNLNHEIVMGPGFLASNMAQSAASFGVALRTKSREVRQLAVSTGITALFGITEPAMYGVTLKHRFALLAVIIGGGCGGLYAGLSGLVRYSFGSPGIATLPVFIGEDPMNIIHAVVTMVITFTVTLIAVYVLGVGKDSDNPSEEEKSKPVDAHKNINIDKPVVGREVPLSEVSDVAFSSQALGPTKAYMPLEGKVTAPFSGTVEMTFPTQHAVGLRSEDGAEMLIHVGIDTVSLGGKHFNCLVKEGDQIVVGQELIEFDIEGIQQSNLDPTVIVIITNSDDFETVSSEVEKPNLAFCIN